MPITVRDSGQNAGQSIAGSRTMARKRDSLGSFSASQPFSWWPWMEYCCSLASYLAGLLSPMQLFVIIVMITGNTLTPFLTIEPTSTSSEQLKS